MIVVSTTVSERLDRVINDVNDLMHAGDSPEAKARAQRWLALTLAHVAQQRHWRFLDRSFVLDLPPGADVLNVQGDFDKFVGLWCLKRLRRRTLPEIVEARVRAEAQGRPNGGVPTDYAVEANRRLHLWPAPVGSSATVSVDIGTDTFTGATFALGTPVRVSSSGALPAPLSATTSYYALPVTGGIKLAATPDDVLTGSAIDLTAAGSGTLTLTPLTRLSLVYTVPLDAALVPDHFEPMLVNGILGRYGRHFDRDTLTEAAGDFETRYLQDLRRNAVLHHDFERAYPYEDMPGESASARAAIGAGECQQLRAAGLDHRHRLHDHRDWRQPVRGGLNDRPVTVLPERQIREGR
jgi:hypothetical protein